MRTDLIRDAIAECRRLRIKNEGTLERAMKNRDLVPLLEMERTTAESLVALEARLELACRSGSPSPKN